MTADQFIALFPEFTSGMTSGEVTAFKARVVVMTALAAPYFNLERWGGFYLEGLANLVANNIVLADAAAAARIANPTIADGGAIVTETAGRVSYALAAAVIEKQVKDPALRTIYGQRYAYLRTYKAGMGGVVV